MKEKEMKHVTWGRIEEVNFGTSGQLLCPRCGGEWLHHGRTQVWTRPQEDAESTVADTDPDGPLLGGNPSRRRDGLRIAFWCEGCGDGMYLEIAQHKGFSLVSWADSLVVPDEA